MDSTISAKKKAEGRKASPNGDYTLKDHYLDQIKLVPGLGNLLEGAALKEDDEYYHVRSAADFSYAADRYAVDHYRLIGDASGKPSVTVKSEEGFVVDSVCSIH